MTETDTTGAKLRRARRRLRLSQSAVAAFVGTTRQAIAAFEQGTKQPDLRQMVGMANIYRLTLDELVARARSAARPTVVPAFAPRFNTDEGLTDQDREELASFEQYLRQRPRPANVTASERAPFEPVSVTVDRLCSELGFAKEAPLPVFAMLARRGVEVRFTSLGELAGALLMPDDGPRGVLINSDQPTDRQRFSAAHELGHLVLGHAPKKQVFISYLGRRFDAEEAHADQFASELLVPTKLLEERLPTLREGDEPLPHKVYRLALTFMVSFQAMTMRLAKLGVLLPGDSEALEKAKPGEIAKAVGLRKRAGDVPFKAAWLPEIAKRDLPSNWQTKAGPDVVRVLQEAAYSDYMIRVEEGARADVAGTVYERVAVWIAERHPIVAA